MNQIGSDQNDTRDKNSLNMLAYFGKRKFDVKFLIIYILGAGVIGGITNFILDGGQMTDGGWRISIIAGLIIGSIMYFWDLRKAQKEE